MAGHPCDVNAAGSQTMTSKNVAPFVTCVLVLTFTGSVPLAARGKHASEVAPKHDPASVVATTDPVEVSTLTRTLPPAPLAKVTPQLMVGVGGGVAGVVWRPNWPVTSGAIHVGGSGCWEN